MYIFLRTQAVHGTKKPKKNRVSEFLLLGLTEKPELHTLLFGLFLSVYLVTIFGNLLIVLAIITDSRLHTPMYFFLSKLSLVDTFFSSTTVPKMLVNLWTQNQVISFVGCLAQIYTFHLLGTMDSSLLAVMAIDRFVAIVYPLCYSVIISPCVCGLLGGVGAWLISNLRSLMHTCLMAQLTFCAGSEIPHFFCDLMPLLKLSCSDTHTSELVIFAFGIIMGISPLSCILLSYTSAATSLGFTGTL
ncbi:olfactory receptor 1I1-like [Leptonychotes weddellii]|uniref:Olfactory receptor n=1 Tax=Leptonychotes weddellii TaxID=9713 RepID=A0A2U3Y384_LEPWE|nr:olfactory receptor 1I1-like [Leptonychotes weddellii]